jgi:hypothetical protein
MVKVNIDSQECNMELDTGAAISSMCIKEFRKLFPSKKVSGCNLTVRTYTGEVIQPLGFVNVDVISVPKTFTGRLYIFKQNVDSILGREWIQNMDVVNLISSCQKANVNQFGLKDKRYLTKKITKSLATFLRTKLETFQLQLES